MNDQTKTEGGGAVASSDLLDEIEHRMMVCPSCHGSGEWETECCNGSGGCSCRGQVVPMGRCNMCCGRGEVPETISEEQRLANCRAISGLCFKALAAISSNAKLTDAGTKTQPANVARNSRHHRDVKYLLSMDEIERRADAEASEFLIPKERLESFVIRTQPYFSKERIIAFAFRMSVHPGIVVGQLQHLGKIPWKANREMLNKVRDLVTTAAATDGFGKQFYESK